MNFQYDLIDAMREYDLHINQINTEPGKYHRFRSLGTCKTKCCEYRVFENELGAHFKCFRRGIDRFWFAKSEHKPSIQDRTLMQLERDRINRERIIAQEKAANKCKRFFHKLTQLKAHPYVTRKGIYPHNARGARGLCVLPIQNIDGDIQSLQFIKPNGFKQFKTGAPTSGGMIWLGDPIDENYAGVLRICEGWSTGCTIYSMTKSPVVCALNAYNLIKVAIAIRQKYKKAIGKICADNDKWGKENVGLNCALEAGAHAGYSVHYPCFDAWEVAHKPTDFNDLFQLVGNERTKNQLVLIRR